MGKNYRILDLKEKFKQLRSFFARVVVVQKAITIEAQSKYNFFFLFGLNGYLHSLGTKAKAPFTLHTANNCNSPVTTQILSFNHTKIPALGRRLKAEGNQKSDILGVWERPDDLKAQCLIAYLLFLSWYCMHVRIESYKKMCTFWKLRKKWF